MPRFDIEMISKYVNQLFTRVGISETSASIITENLLFADLRGVSSHGLTRVSPYIQRIKTGTVNACPIIKTVIKRPSMLVLDADGGMGQVGANSAMKKAINMAGTYGTGSVFVRNSNHFGMASYFTRMAAQQGMVAIAFSNAPPAMAAWGGAEPVLGTNPLSFAFPDPMNQPILIDMATSTVARGKIREAAKQNKKIHSSWALDGEGNPTTDANKALNGTLSPFGGVKGYCLAVVVEMMSGVFAGAGYSKKLEQVFGGAEGQLELEQRVGHSFIVINAKDLVGDLELNDRMNVIRSFMKDGRKVQGKHEVFMPGEIEDNLDRENKKIGVLISKETFDNLIKLGKELAIKQVLNPKSN